MTTRNRSQGIDLSGWRFLLFLAACFTIAYFSARAAFSQVPQIPSAASEPLIPSAVDGPADPGLALELLDKAPQAGWSFVFAAVLIGFVWLFRTFGAELARMLGIRWLAAFLASDRAGPLFVLVLSGLGALITAFAAGQRPSVALCIAAAGIGVKAIGGYVGVRKILGITNAPADA